MSSQDRILTIPNGLTLLRALGIPLFLWVYLADHRPLASFLILAAGAATDYLDGKLARALHQESKLGAIMDPAIDRAYIAATIISLAVRDVIPVWLVLLLIGRDVWLALVLAVVRSRGGRVFTVTFLGKAATFNLLYAFPLLLVSSSHGFGRATYILGWSFAIWGVALYVITGIQYSLLGLLKNSSHYREIG